MPDISLKEKMLSDLRAFRKHSEYSYHKARKISLAGDLSEEDLETLESFPSNFARCPDLEQFLARKI